MTDFLKTLIDLLEPPALVWLILSLIIVPHLRRRRWRALLLPGFAWVVLTVTGSLPVSHHLLASLEDDWVPVSLAALPECDAIVMLGGGLEPSANEPAGMHLQVGADRLFTALELARQGKGRELVIGGGVFDLQGGGRISEADGVREWIKKDWPGITIPLRSLGGCADTHDEAVRVAALVREKGWTRVILVTSAFHMTRSKAVFEKAGVPVLPVPCNYLSGPMRGRPVAWFAVPNAAYLATFETWMHETVGWWGYRMRGWI